MLKGNVVNIHKKACGIIASMIALLGIALYILTKMQEENVIYQLESVGNPRQAVDTKSIVKLYNLFNTTEKPEPASKYLFNIVNNACPNIAKTLYKLSATYMQHCYYEDAYKAYNLAAHLKPSRFSTIFL
jgi:hypothetical protein